MMKQIAEWVRSKYMSSYHDKRDELGRVTLLPSGRWVASLGTFDYIAECATRRGAERAVEKKVRHG